MPGNSSVMQPLKVLYVEDHDGSREELAMLLELLFSGVTVACNGKEGLERYDPLDHDIVITDINMPVMNGLEMIRRIRKIRPEQCCVVVSAHNDSAHLLESIEAGVDGFVIKPIKSDQLLQTLERVARYAVAAKERRVLLEQLEHEVEEKTARLLKQLREEELTGLLNMRALREYLEDEKRYKTLLLLNIDNFDSLNTTYGYETGDEVLKRVAEFIRGRLLPGDKAFRIGSDEFAILSFTRDVQQMYQFGQGLLETIAQEPIYEKDEVFRIKITCSGAVAGGRKQLLKNTHVALKEAKKEGRNRLRIYENSSILEKKQIKLQICAPRLHLALKEKRIVSYYQPIVSNETGMVEKFECLVRIRCDDGSLKTPGDFIEVAEDVGYIPELTRQLIDNVFRVFSPNEYGFSINITEHDLKEGYLHDYLMRKSQEYDIDPSRVILEVLEQVNELGYDYTDLLKELKREGFQIAIDDFGTLNSNFERFMELNVDFIKIDGKYIKNLPEDDRSHRIVRAMVEFARSMQTKVVAEFVHSEEIFREVQALGIDYSQGYYFSEPVESVRTFIEDPRLFV